VPVLLGRLVALGWLLRLGTVLLGRLATLGWLLRSGRRGGRRGRVPAAVAVAGVGLDLDGQAHGHQGQQQSGLAGAHPLTRSHSPHSLHSTSSDQCVAGLRRRAHPATSLYTRRSKRPGGGLGCPLVIDREDRHVGEGGGAGGFPVGPLGSPCTALVQHGPV
jgi:hypothetical protein